MIINFFFSAGQKVQTSSMRTGEALSLETSTGGSTMATLCIIARLGEIRQSSTQAPPPLPLPHPPEQTKSGIALLYNEESNNTYDVCLKLTRDALTIQKLDVVCTGGAETQVNVSAPEGSRRSSEFTARDSHSTVSMSNVQYLFATKKLPSSKAQDCYTAETGERRPGPEHQSKHM